MEKISIKTNEGLEFVNKSEISHIEAISNYSKVILENNKCIIANDCLAKIQLKIDSEEFFRIHKSYLINLNHTKKYIKQGGGTIVMTNGAEINISRNKKDDFLKLMKEN